jgi:hypothetical protein
MAEKVMMVRKLLKAMFLLRPKSLGFKPLGILSATLE